MKRFFSFMMSLVLVFSLGVTAFAAENTGTITITNATVDKEYSVFKIFGATFNGTSTTYTIKPGDPFFEDLFGADGNVKNDYFEYHASTGVITRKDGKNDEQLIAYLTGLVKDKKPTVDPITATSETVEFTGLEYGYYVITSTLGAAVTIDEVKPTAEVIDKNQKITDLEKLIWDEDANKWVKASSSNVGDVVNFKVTFTASNYNGETKIEMYTIRDTLSSAWADIDTDNIKVKVGDKTLAAGDFTVTPTLTDGVTIGFKLEIPWVDDNTKEFKYASPVDVEVTYSATVLDAAASADPANKNNQNSVTSDWDSEGDNTTTKVYNMGFTKVDGTDATKTLAGAKFELYSDKDCEVSVNVKETDIKGVYTVTTESGFTNEVVTPEGGKVVIMGLKEGTYYLKETKAPDGYNLMDKVEESWPCRCRHR